MAAIRQREMDPVGIATTASRRLTYAEGVPYRRPLGGTAESVGPFSPNAAAEFVAARYRPQGSGLVIVGDVDAGQVTRLILRHRGVDRADLFDIYAGENIAEGTKSLAFHVYFQARDRTLTNVEVNRSLDGLLRTLERELKVTLRA